MIPIAKPVISDDEIREVDKVLKSGYLVAGERVRKFEREFAGFCGAGQAVACANGTSALNLLLDTLDIEKGDEVVTTPFSFIASSNCILFAGARPVFADIDPKTFNIDPEEIEEKITENTKAVLVVHLFGQPCDMGAISDICEDNGLIIIEDAAQAHGAEYGGKKAGSLGDYACFSFYPTKNMTTGEGGMITTDNSDMAEKLKMLVDIGQDKKYSHGMLGRNLRMTEMAGAIGLGQLKKLEERNERRIKNAEFLTNGLSDVDGIDTPFVSPKVKHVFHQYVIRNKSRDQLKEFLENRGIQTSVHYPIPIYKQRVYKEMGFELSFDNAERASGEVLSLPVHPQLSIEDLERIITEVEDFS